MSKSARRHRPGSSSCWTSPDQHPEDQVRGHRLRPGDHLRRGRQAGCGNLLTILAALTGTAINTLVERVRGPRLRRSEGAVAEAVTEFADALPGPHPGADGGARRAGGDPGPGSRAGPRGGQRDAGRRLRKGRAWSLRARSPGSAWWTSPCHPSPSSAGRTWPGPLGTSSNTNRPSSSA